MEKGNNKISDLKKKWSRYHIISKTFSKIICRRYYVERILKEINFIGNPSNSYSTANRCLAEIVDNNKEYS